MAKTIIGKVSLTPKGTYVSGNSYEKLDIVSYNGTSYIAKSNTSSVPTNSEYWLKLFNNYDTDVEEIKQILNDVDSQVTVLIEEMAQAKVDILDIEDDIEERALISETGKSIEQEINSTTYVLTTRLKDKNGNVISIANVDLPLETMVVNARYDSTTKEIILTLQNGNEVRFSVADLVSGLQSEITSSNKLSSDLVDDENNVHKFVSNTEKETWNNKIDETALTDYVKNTNYATDNVGGVIKSSTAYANGVNQYGRLYAVNLTYAIYQTAENQSFIGKGTLENVIAGKDLTTKSYVDGLVGDIGTILDNINGESVGA